MVVDVAYVAHLNPPVTLDTLKTTPGLEKMMVIQRGSRLSIQPVTPKEWEIVLNLTQQVS
jgi:predicted RNA-binding protein with PUA-like domain